jgi:manganese/zinc/iron transport system substrate-binding protein
LIRLAAVVLAVLALTGCSRVEEDEAARLGDGTIGVVATTGMVADLVERVGGERVEVEALMGPGVDPHLYKASEGDVERLVEADLIAYSGLHLEAKLADVLERLGRRAFAVTDAIPRRRLLAPPEFAGQYDPHVWFDVRLWMDALRQVERTLSERDPEHAALYRRNASAYLRELGALDRDVRDRIATIPRRQRVLITAHDAFNYFGRAYGLEVRGLQGISTASEAGAGDIRELADFIAEREIPALFVESSVSPRAIEAVREAVRARGFEVEIGGSLYSDAMGDPGTPEGTYPGMVGHNVDAIVAGLGGEL